MNPSIITIIVLGIVSILVVGLMVFAYYQIIKSTKRLSANGLLDEEYKQEVAHKRNRVLGIVLNVFSISITCLLVTFCAVGVYYKANGEQFSIHNKTAMVIASNSMEYCTTCEYENKLIEDVKIYYDWSQEEAVNYIYDSEFNVGDVLTFSLTDENQELELYKVYGYKNRQGQIIVHRLVNIIDDKYIFRGDNTPGNDNHVTRDQILYRYDNSKIGGVGYFVLFSSSSFGVYSLVIVIAVFIMSDIAKHKYDKIRKMRLSVIEVNNNEAK